MTSSLSLKSQIMLQEITFKYFRFSTESTQHFNLKNKKTRRSMLFLDQILSGMCYFNNIHFQVFHSLPYSLLTATKNGSCSNTILYTICSYILYQKIGWLPSKEFFRPSTVFVQNPSFFPRATSSAAGSILHDWCNF